MAEVSSGESSDEEEVISNFDAEAQLIVETESLPKKSADKYILVYSTYQKWKQANKNALSESEENNLIVYIKSLSKKLCPSTIWSVHSMLKSTLKAKNNINVDKFYKLKTLVKNNAKRHRPKKSAVLTWDEVIKFINDASDHTHLAHKVILIFGICGATRCEELKELQVTDIEDLGGKYLVSIKDSKNGLPRKFLIGALFYERVKKYISLKPPDLGTDRFFIKFSKGKFHRQVIGRNKIGQIPKIIADYLGLANSERYTGHCLRRTSATLISNSGGNITMLKQLGGWKSTTIAEGYIENSLLNRQNIFDKITHAKGAENPLNLQSATNETQVAKAQSQSTQPQTSTSGTSLTEPQSSNKKRESSPVEASCDNDNFFDDFDWDDKTLAEIDQSFVLEQSKEPEKSFPSFTTGNNKRINITANPGTDRPCHFLKKPPISVFLYGKENRPPEKRIKVQESRTMNNNEQSVPRSTNFVMNQQESKSSSTKKETQKLIFHTKSTNLKIDKLGSESSSMETTTNINPNVKYDNCVFHGNIINNFYYSTDKTPEKNM